MPVSPAVCQQGNAPENEQNRTTLGVREANKRNLELKSRKKKLKS